MSPSSPRRVGVPWSVQIELVEGCNRLCSFCGIHAIRKRPNEDIRLMSLPTALLVAVGIRKLCSTARIELAMHGEPLLHPQARDLVGLFRHALPAAQLQLTTNGKVLLGDMQSKLDKLFAAGLDILVLDTYRPERDALRAEAARLGRVQLIDFYDTRSGLVPFSPWHNYRRKYRRVVVLMDDLGDRDGEVASRVIMNHAGGAPLKPIPPEPLKRTCTIPFRELSVCWNGDVCVCCMDWRHEYVCGNLTRQEAQDVWWGAEFEAARAFLGQKDRSFCGPCSRCDAPSGTRCGLLPHYPPPGAAARAAAEACGARGRP